MSLYLNRTKIPGYKQKISLRMTLAGEDMSGNSSSTQQAETGNKPKALAISTSIKFLDSKDLARLVALAEAKNAAGERLIYSVINATAQAANIRQVRFQGEFRVREEYALEAWAISFDLVEYRSIAEKVEERQNPASLLEQISAGQPIVPDLSGGSAAGVVDLSSIEKVLQTADKILK